MAKPADDAIRAARWRPRLWAALLLLPACFGCSCSSGRKGQPVFPVQGKVLFMGEPASGAFVVFHSLSHADPEEGKPRAVVEDDGSFAVATYTAKDGAPAGDYAVSITWKRKAVRNPSGKGTPRKIPTNFPERYEDPRTSGLVVHIEEGPNELLPFDLKN